MHLPDFIIENLDSILEAWDTFAGTVETPLPQLNAVGLRNHAELILRNVARDMRTAQSIQQQIDKSHGLGPVVDYETAAQSHAVTRLDAGFSMDQMVSEYRALRSSVLRLWLPQRNALDPQSIDEMVRFNEAIDQALGESIASYSKAVEATRMMVLGVLGHDLRTPLGAASMGAEMLSNNNQLTNHDRRIASQITLSVTRANEIVNDLLDLARVNLGTGIPVRKESVELSALCEVLVNEIRACHSGVHINFERAPALRGQFDPKRLGQAFSNLISNAVKHGDALRPITVALRQDGQAAIFSVHNFGEHIPEAYIPYLFNPQSRFSRYAAQEYGASAGLGLGLFIASEIVTGHGGALEVESSQTLGTTFQASLPIS